MKLLELMEKANSLYPDGQLSEYYDGTGKFKDNPHGGDGLARFIVAELSETYTPETPDASQLEEAVRVLVRARNDIDAVIAALEESF